MRDRALRFIIYVAVLTFPAPVCLADEADFRNVTWGMTRLEVMASEDKAPESFGEPYIYYKPEVMGRRLHLFYEFVHDQLIDAVYIIVTRDSRDYLRYKKNLERKHGKPEFSLDEGGHAYRFVWKSPATEIILRPGRSRECRIEYVGIHQRYLKKEIQQMKKEKMIAELFNSF